MEDAWNFEKCVTVLTDEIELSKKISAVQDKLRQAVMKREWSNFEDMTVEVNHLSEKFACLESVRARLFFALTYPSKKSDVPEAEASAAWTLEEKPFYAAIMGLPSEERRKLSGLYRELKMETLKMRALNETFLAYLNEAKNLAAAYLEAVCPARGGKLYTRDGRRVSQDLRSIVVNNRF